MTVKLHTRLQVESSDIAHERTDHPSAVMRLLSLVPPGRTDLIEHVERDLGRITPVASSWPPRATMYELVSRVRRVHAGDVALVGADGERVEVLDYIGKTGQRRLVYRLTRHGIFINEFKTIEELADEVDLSTLHEERRD